MVTIAQARKGLADLVSRAAYTGERIVLSKHGKAACALVPLSALKDLEEMERREDALDMKLIEERKDEPAIPWETVKAEMDAAHRKTRKKRAVK